MSGKNRRNALIALAQLSGWEVGYLYEVWWSCMSQPNLHSWEEKRLMRELRAPHDSRRHLSMPETKGQMQVS